VGKEDKVILIALRDELSHRKSRPAIRLREDVDGQIADLEARGLWSRPQPVGISMPGSHQGFLDRGLLNFLDYKVGAARLARSLRHRLLASIALRSLPPFHSAEYMLSWSTPDTEERLLRLANCIAGFTRLAKRRRMANMRDSIADWESDLEYLRREFYQGHWSFIWPET
jgi:hypothetical protein